MPRLRVIKPVCPSCGTARYVGCYLGEWFCFAIHDALPSFDARKDTDG